MKCLRKQSDQNFSASFPISPNKGRHCITKYSGVVNVVNWKWCYSLDNFILISFLFL